MNRHDEGQDGAGDVAVALHQYAAAIEVHPAAWQTLSRGVTRRRRVRRAAGAGLALSLALMALPVVDAARDVFGERHTGDVAIALPGSAASAEAPVWPLVSESQIAAWLKDPIVGIVPDVTTAEAAARGFMQAVLGQAQSIPLTVHQDDPDRATVSRAEPSQARPGTAALALELTRFGAQGPWLVTDVTGRALTVKTPSRGTAVLAGAAVAGTAPAHVTGVYVRMFAQGADQGTQVAVTNGRWSTPVPPDLPAGPVSIVVQLQPDDGVDAAASTFVLRSS